MVVAGCVPQGDRHSNDLPPGVSLLGRWWVGGWVGGWVASYPFTVTKCLAFSLIFIRLGAAGEGG